jgi:hypothetical protein
VAERLPLIGAILIPRYTTVRSDLAEERVREVFFVAINQIWDIAGTSASHIAGETSQKKRSMANPVANGAVLGPARFARLSRRPFLKR